MRLPARRLRALAYVSVVLLALVAWATAAVADPAGQAAAAAERTSGADAAHAPAPERTLGDPGDSAGVDASPAAVATQRARVAPGWRDGGAGRFVSAVSAVLAGVAASLLLAARRSRRAGVEVAPRGIPGAAPVGRRAPPLSLAV